jgi:hypothetical protein
MKTMSATSISACSLSTSLPGKPPVGIPLSSSSTRRGPNAPRWSHTEDEPGPPLKQKTSGSRRGICDAVAGVGDREERRLLLALFLAQDRALAVAVYAIFLRPIVIVCEVWTTPSSWCGGGGRSSGFLASPAATSGLALSSVIEGLLIESSAPCPRRCCSLDPRSERP